MGLEISVRIWMSLILARNHHSLKVNLFWRMPSLQKQSNSNPYRKWAVNELKIGPRSGRLTQIHANSFIRMDP